jgi:hypothetical protein
MLIENGVVRVRAGLNPVIVTVPLGTTSRRGMFARAGDLHAFSLYAKTFPGRDPHATHAGHVRLSCRELDWLSGPELGAAVGLTDAKGTTTTAALGDDALRGLFVTLRVYKNATNFEAALSLAWHAPMPGVALVIGAAGAAERRVRHLAARAGVVRALVLDPHRWVIADESYDDETPPWDSVLGRASARLALVPAPDAPLVVLAERAPRRAGETGTTVAIDFGTHETSVVTQREGQRDVTVQGPLAPWSFYCVSVSMQGAAWHAELMGPPRSFEERTTLGNPVMPPPLSERWSVLARRDASQRREGNVGIPSVLIPREAQPPGLLGHPFDALTDQVIGTRALRLIDRAIERGDAPESTAERGLEAPTDREPWIYVDALEPAPKLQLGRTPKLARDFLDGVFDELAAKEIVRGAPSESVLGTVGPVLLSYPVAFLAQDRETLQQVARDALEHGALRGLCGETPDAPVTFLDEATAASLGVLYHRFGSLALTRLLDAYQPIDAPGDGSAPRSVRILTFDCGGGTTDLVLLRLREDDDRVVSEIEDFYGLPFAGVEITRRICRELKRRLRATLPPDQVDRLRTRFSHDDEAPGALRTEVERLRQKRTLGFFYFGEAVKFALASPSALDEGALRAGLAARAHQYLPDLDVARVLGAIPTRAWLEECTATVLAPALETAERWLARETAPVQMVVASGRSSQLPGVCERLRAACGRAPRPVLAQHFLSPRELAGNEQGFGFLDLQAAQRGGARADLSKFGVAIGLAHGYVLTTKTGEGRRLVVKPIDEHKRTRYVGVLRQEGRGVQFVMPEDRLVVRGDGGAVDADTVVWIDEQPFAARAVLGQNFRGPPRAGTTGSVDPPIPFAQVRFTPSSLSERERLGIKRMQVGFTQRTASEVVLAGLRVERNGGVEESLAGPDGAPSLSVAGLTAHFESRRLEFDFRRNGVIDPEDLDRD